MWFHWVGGQETRWFDGVEQGRLVEVPSYLLPSLLQSRVIITSFHLIIDHLRDSVLFKVF